MGDLGPAIRGADGCPAARHFRPQLRWNKIGGLRWPERKPKSAHHEPPIAELLAALSGKTFPKPPDEDNIPF